MSAALIQLELHGMANKAKASDLQRYFKTGPGQYGEGDLFLGVAVPEIRRIATEFKDLKFVEITKLLNSNFHEARMCGLVILSNQYRKLKDQKQKKEIFQFFLQNLKNGNINNWDLIDTHAAIIGDFLIEEKNRMSILKGLAKSESLWERRASVIFTFALIRVGELNPTIEIAKLLLKDQHDLIHKSTGWALREIGKKDVMYLRRFLSMYSPVMSRTSLRYSIEKLPKAEQKKWLDESKI